MKVIFLGIQGSGKSTQAKLFAEKFNLPYIEMGQLLRDHATNHDPQAQDIKKALDAGVLVTDEITNRTLNKKLNEYQEGYVLDGYPRNQAQLANTQNDIDQVYYVKITDDEAVTRLLKRGREDDTPDLLKKRMELYHQETEPIIEFYRQKGILEEVDGQRPIEVVNRDILSRVKNNHVEK